MAAVPMTIPRALHSLRGQRCGPKSHPDLIVELRRLAKTVGRSRVVLENAARIVDRLLPHVDAAVGKFPKSVPMHSGLMKGYS